MTPRTGRCLLLTTIAALLLTGFTACSSTRSTTKSAAGAPVAVTIPDVPREFRAVWVATVANIDWPSKPGLSTQEQQDEFIKILERCQAMKFNAVVLQVRPTADALYASELEPWSYYLTGEMGKAPEPFYDPLAFAVQEAHKRGMELHAWFNPYRALHPNNKGEVSANHISKTHPEIVKKYGPYLWMDPSEPLVQEHSLNVILDVVRRYDIDGVHMDDYFYPYKVQDDKGKDVEFPDDKSWGEYQQAGGKLSRDDWRRKSVDDFIEKLYKLVKKEKKHVQVGLSPFGIWKPGHPAQIKGFNQYEGLYADAKLWFNKGWVDYYTPQLYWEIAKPDQSFTALLSWWAGQNKKDRHLWPGLAPYRTGNQFGENEIQYQVKWTRIITPNDPGAVHFSMKAFMDPEAPLAKQLQETVYAQPALPPATPWLGSKRPVAPVAEVTGIKDGVVTVQADNAMVVDGLRWWVIQADQGGKWSYNILPATQTIGTLKLASADAKVDRVVVSSVSRTGIQSNHRLLTLPVSSAPIEQAAESAEEAAEDVKEAVQEGFGQVDQPAAKDSKDASK
ncbi:MAG: family 10 glycosylhydrolase [Phycisphaerales bacterium]